MLKVGAFDGVGIMYLQYLQTWREFLIIDKLARHLFIQKENEGVLFETFTVINLGFSMTSDIIQVNLGTVSHSIVFLPLHYLSSPSNFRVVPITSCYKHSSGQIITVINQVAFQQITTQVGNHFCKAKHSSFVGHIYFVTEFLVSSDRFCYNYNYTFMSWNEYI